MPLCVSFIDTRKRRIQNGLSWQAVLRVLSAAAPVPPMRAVISSSRSRGNGGSHRGFMAMLMSFMGLSSAAIRLELSLPQRRHRWMTAHSPPFLTHTAMGSMTPPQPEERSPGSSSTWRLHRQLLQWFLWPLPALSRAFGQKRFPSLGRYARKLTPISLQNVSILQLSPP